MKLISKSGQIIEVDEAHASILIGQKSWTEYKEPSNGLQNKGQEAPKEVVTFIPPVVKRGAKRNG